MNAEDLPTSYGHTSGTELPKEEVRKGREQEFDNLLKFKVFRKRRRLEYRGKVVKSRWTEDWKSVPSGWIVRCRLVAQELAMWDAREDVHAGTPPLKLMRILVSNAATKKPRNPARPRKLAVYDVSVAFMHAPIQDQIAIVPSVELREDGIVWELLQAINGTRKASASWGAKVTGTFEDAGVRVARIVPNFFIDDEHDGEAMVHGDDFLCEGDDEAIGRFDEVIMGNYEAKRMGKIGPGEQHREISFLNRRIVFVEGRGFKIIPDPRHAATMSRALGLDGANVADTPASKTVGKGVRDSDKPLKEADAKLFRTVAGTGLYLSSDRYDLSFAMKEVMRGMVRPTVLDMLKLRRVVKYLNKYPDYELVYDYQPVQEELQVFVDSDWAGELPTRKSTTSTLEQHGAHEIDHYAGSQQTLSLSSGEAEFYAIGSGAARGIQTANMFSEMHVKLVPVIRSDSSAGRSMTRRVGTGKVRHLELRYLWVQEKLAKGAFRLVKEASTTNLADLGTKALENERFMVLLRRCGVELPVQQGRSHTAVIGALFLFFQLGEAALTKKSKAMTTEENWVTTGKEMMLYMGEYVNTCYEFLVEYGFLIVFLFGMVHIIWYIVNLRFKVKLLMKRAALTARPPIRRRDASVQTEEYIAPRFAERTVPQLRTDCVSYGVDSSGLKSDLVLRLEKAAARPVPYPLQAQLQRVLQKARIMHVNVPDEVHVNRYASEKLEEHLGTRIG